MALPDFWLLEDSDCDARTLLQGGEDRSLVFDCSFEGGEITIDSVHIEDPSVNEVDAYPGPEYG